VASKQSGRRPARGPEPPPLSLNLLGEIELRRGDARLPLPPSKKTRALLGYLAVTGRSHRRERLCELLWDVADDPRAALRWSLSKLRALVDEPGGARIKADRDGVALVADGMQVDLFDLRRTLQGGETALATPTLRELAARFRGEFLEGLELTDFFDFHAWCVALRAEVRSLRGRVLATLVERLDASPEDALPYAFALVGNDAVVEGSRATLVRLLGRAGRYEEAAQQFEAGMRLFKELHTTPSGDLVRAFEEVKRRPHAASLPQRRSEPRAPAGPEPGAAPTRTPLVGRAAQLAALRAIVDSARASSGRALLLLGDPGVGKSRLLHELVDEASRRGAAVLDGRAYEAERGRPYGVWIDALQRLPHFALGDAYRAQLGPLLEGHTQDEPSGRTREHLFGAIAALLAERATAESPVLLLLDDVQWCDEASAELLHYVVRTGRRRPLAFVLAARAGELPDNAPMGRVLRSLRHERLLEDVPVGPLDAVETSRLVASVAPSLGPEGERVYAHSAGNPLFVLELARSLSAHGDSWSPTLREVVRGRVDGLPGDAADVLRWGAVLGRTFNVRTLLELAALDLDALVVALDRLERHALVTTLADPDEPLGAYAFAHEIVRSVVYGEMSEPRRRLMHLRVARALEPRAALDERVAADVAHHASLAGDAGLAARACVSAGRRSLRLFANATAESLVRRGMRYAEQLPEPERVQRSLELFEIAVAARRPTETEDIARTLERLADAALDHGCFEHARLGFHLLSYLRWEGGDWSDAQRHMMRAELVSRSADARERSVATAEAACCLAMLERDLAHAEALLLEAKALAVRAGVDPPAVSDALGMLHLHHGRFDEAAAAFGDARAAALRDGDRQAEFRALEHLVMTEIERERWDAAHDHTLQLLDIAARLREGSETPFAKALLALCVDARAASTPATETEADAIAEACAELRRVDAKHRLAFTLNRAADLDLSRRRARPASLRATEALALARILAHPSETALALVTLAHAAGAAGDRDAMACRLDELAALDLSAVSHTARVRVEALRRGVEIGGRHHA
jgi:DNA-binding SARP family transcriptional activator